MASHTFMSRLVPSIMAVVEVPSSVRGKFVPNNVLFYENQALSTDPVGVVTLSFSGVKDGSEIKLYNKDLVELAGSESTSGIPSFSLSRFPVGSLYNTVRVLINSLSYELIDFTLEVPVKDSTIPVFQRIDRNYRNPV